jgi:translation initiation factor IF-1
MDRDARIANQSRLRELKLGHGDRVRIVNSHDPVDYENCRCGAH